VRCGGRCTTARSTCRDSLATTGSIRLAATLRLRFSLRRRVRTHLSVLFNAVGLNLYRNGRDSVAPHNDHLYELREGFPIALVSLGATRRMTIRANTAPRRTTHIDLEPGSLFVMDYVTQLHYTHGVPKTHEPVGERISLAFRVKPDRTTSDKGRNALYK
jgi:alkylated DNA repair dioxygenase AlkB